MKKNIVLITAFILAATLIFAWSDQPTITKTHVMTDISVDQQVIKEVTPNVNSYSRELGSNEVPFMVDRKDSKKEVAEEVEISQEMSRLEVHQANLIALKAAGEPIPIVVMEDTCSGDSIQIEILTDSYYSETTWELYDQIGPTLIASGAPTAASTVHNWQVCVEVDQCYDFYVYDSYGDGIYAPGYCDVSLNGALIWHFAQEWTTVATGELGGGCAAPEGACCVAEVCVATNTEAECDGLGGSWHIGETCPEYWCEDDWNCTDNPPTDKDPGGDIDTPSEPLNDSLSGAAPAFVEHAYCGTLAPPVDPDDYYVVTLPAGPDPFYCLHVRVFADDTPHQYAYGLGLDTKLYIYDDDSLNTQLYYQDDNNGTFPDAEHYDSQYDCTNPDNCYPAGKTLYIRVSGFSSVDPVPYLLIINAIPCEGDPLGRCCYGDPYAPTCTDETEGDCDALTGTWDFGLNCVDDPCVALPANDECADAQVITEVTDYTFTTVGATTDGINNYANQNVWFCYTPATDGEVTIDMCDSDFDTRVAVYDGCDICADTLTNYLVGSDDDGCPTRTLMSLMTFSATGGQAYLIETGGYGANTGTIVMDITLVADPPGRCCYGDPYAPDCIDAITESECTTTYSGVFTVGLNCVDNPCDVLCPEDELMLILDTDSYGSETSWDVINHNDPADTIASGGPYASLSHFEEQICMGTADCIDVYIYDAYGDGGPDYDILLNDVSLFSGTIAGFGEAFMNIGNGCVTIVGACCDDVTGICVDDVAEDDCPIENRWVAETLCADIYPPCGVPLGSCCYDEGILPACAINTQAECDVLGGTWTEDGTCADCPMCVDADYDNGQPFDDYGSPASQYINDFPISAEAADDFFLPGLGLTQVMMVTAWTTHWNGPANPSYYDHVNVTIYADYEFGTPDTSWPAGYMGDDGVHVEFEAGGVVFTEDVTDFTYWQLPRDCTGDLWQLNLALSNCILDLGTKYWIVVQPDMSFSGVGQCAFALSDMNTGDAAKTNFPYLGTPAWTEFDGNAGVCDTLAPEGTLTDMAFCLDIQEPECELIDPPWESTDVFMDNLNDSYAPPGDPRGSQWHELWPNYCTNWDLTSWLDNGDSTLSTGDYVDFTAAAASCYTLEVVYIGPTVILTNIMAPGDTIYMDQLQVDQADPFPPVTDVLLSQWKGIWPVQAQCLCDPCEHPDGPLACPCNWMVTGWEDNGNGVLDSCDYIEMTYCDMLGGETIIEIFHVEGIAIDIVLRKIPTINQIQDSLTVVGIGDDCWPSPYDGEPVAVNGTVVAITQTDSLHPYPNYFLQDCATEDFNGIYVYDDAHGDMALGDHVTVSGEIDEYYGLTELKNVTGLITIPDADEPLCTLVVTDSDELWECDPTAADGENLEGVLVMLENVTVSSTASGGRAWVRTAGATDSVEVDDDLYKYGTDQPEPWEVGATYDYIVGMVQYTYGNYELWPRFAADVAELGYQYLPGDANMGFGTTGLWPPRVVGGDVTYLVNYFIYETHTPGCFIDYGDSLFFMSGDANGDCQVIGSDVTKLVNHFRFELPDSVKEIVPCSLYTTVWPDTAVIPEVQPDGWPPCDHILNPPPASTPKVIPNGLIK